MVTGDGGGDARGGHLMNAAGRSGRYSSFEQFIDAQLAIAEDLLFVYCSANSGTLSASSTFREEPQEEEIVDRRSCRGRSSRRGLI